MSAVTLEPPVVALSAKKLLTKRLLLVAYNFPPVGGAGVQRPVKWAKYLGKAGWDVTVLTTANPSVPARDESLLADLPSDVRVVRARTYEPDYRVKQNLIQQSEAKRPGMAQQFKGAIKGLAKRCVKLALQPDPQVLWNYDAIRVGTRTLQQQPHDAILVTAPAYSSFFIGAALKRRFGLPLVLDYRDEWDLSGKYLENAQRDWFSRVIQTRMQSRLLKQADAVIATTRRSTQALEEKLLGLRHSIPSHCIYNGFDAEDFEVPAGDQLVDDVVPKPEPGKFRLVYTGTLWNLTDIEPLIRAIELLHSQAPQMMSKLELVCVGRKTAEQTAVLDRLRTTATKLVSIDYCEHSTALQWLRSACGLCLLLTDVPGADRVVPAKLFEYLAIRKDMLAISPDGETSEIVRQFCPEGHFHPNQIEGIASWLSERLTGADVHRPTDFDRTALNEFSRQEQASRLGQLLDSLVLSQQGASL